MTIHISDSLGRLLDLNLQVQGYGIKNNRFHVSVYRNCGESFRRWFAAVCADPFLSTTVVVSVLPVLQSVRELFQVADVVRQPRYPTSVSAATPLAVNEKTAPSNSCFLPYPTFVDGAISRHMRHRSYLNEEDDYEPREGDRHSHFD